VRRMRRTGAPVPMARGTLRAADRARIPSVR
jgi:hypothetical protein